MRALLVLAFLCPHVWSATLSLGSGDANANGLALIPLNLQSETPVVALQVDVMAEPPVAVFTAPVSAGALGSHYAEGYSAGANTYRIIVYNLFNEPLPNGQVVMLSGSVSPAFVSGSISLALSNAVLASASAAPIPVAVNGGSIRVGFGPAIQLKAVTITQASALRFEVAGLTGASFVLEQSSSLSVWTEAETLPVSGAGAVVVRPIPNGAGARFFRVRAQ